MKPLYYAITLVFLAFGASACEKPIDSGRSNDLVVRDLDFYHSTFLGAHDGMVQIRHDQGGTGADGMPSGGYFMRIVGGESSILNPPSRIVLNDAWGIPLQQDFNVIKDESGIADLFGHTLSLRVEEGDADSLKSITPLVDLGAIPKVLKSNLIQLPQNQLLERTVSWNIDDTNKNGVFIVVDYSPLINQESIAAVHPERCSDYLQIPDGQGSYTFSASDFPCVPANAIASVTLIRGVAKELVNAAGRDVFLAYSTNSGLFEFQ